MTADVLAFGASGKFAGLVVPTLVKLGVDVRGFVRNERDAEKARANGASEVAIGDLSDSESIEHALKGIKRVFYIAPAFLPQEVEAGERVVAACLKAGVERIVFSSVIHPVLSQLSNHNSKAKVEEAILDSGLNYCFLHPALYFQNYGPKKWEEIVEKRVLAEPWSLETRFSRVDFRDVAEVAALAVTEDRLLGGTFELCSEGQLNRHDLAQLIGEVTHRTIKAEKLDPGTLGDQARPMQPMFEHYDRSGLVGNPIILEAILKRKPRTLRAYFEELAFHSERSR